MYEQQTFDAILNRMLERVPSDIDKREGSIIYDALAPAVAELAQMYVELDINYNLSFADTATGDFLSRRTAEFGVERQPATKAIRRGLFYGNDEAPLDIPIGSRYAIDGLVYVATEKISTGVFKLECETAGIAGNQTFGALLPIAGVPGLVSAELTDVLVPGEDEETDEALRSRYYEAVNEPAFGGNVADYRQKFWRHSRCRRRQNNACLEWRRNRSGNADRIGLVRTVHGVDRCRADGDRPGSKQRRRIRTGPNWA